MAKAEKSPVSVEASIVRPVDVPIDSQVVVRVEHLWKQYRMGAINHGTLANDLQSWWARVRGKEDPNVPLDQLSAKRTKHNPGINTSDEDCFWALRDISFDVEQGEILGIVGLNGAGKSTLLKILSKVTTPTEGCIKIRGRVASLLEVGTGFHPELTGRENVFLNGAIFGMTKDEVRAKFDEIVDFSEVGKFIDTPVKRYSSGMYVRLAFAVAAHLESEILVVDEVLAVGDVTFQKKCLGKMNDVRRAGRTILFVSHNMTSVLNLCTKVLWIEKGQIRQLGEPGEVVHNYLRSSNKVLPAAEMDLSDWKNRYGNNEARILSARLLNDHGEVASVFYRDETLTVEFTFQSESKHQLHFSGQILSESGVKLLHTSHHDDSTFQGGVFDGSYVVRLKIPHLPLAAGSYNFILALHTSSLAPVDVVTNVLPFLAEDTPQTKRPYRTVSENGYCWVPNTWEISQAVE